MVLTRQIKFILAVALQLLVIAGIIMFKVSIVTGGQEVLLKIKPVDPRDFLRGDYVTFQYDISDIPLSYFSDPSSIRNGDTVYVPIERTASPYRIAAYGVAKDSSFMGTSRKRIFIKGKVADSSLGESDVRKGFIEFEYERKVHIRYGIEEYFIPEGAGQNVNFWEKEVGAKVAVDEEGRAVLKQLYVNGELWP